MNSTDIFLKGINEICLDSIPEHVFDQAKDCFLDYLACAVAGSTYIRSKNDEVIDSLVQEKGNVPIFGSSKKTSMLNAALLNGINSHYIELDDGHRYGMMHLGAPIFSALLAINDTEALAPKDFYFAAIVGYEVAIRLARCIQPGNKLKGFHATGTCGTIGVAMAVATALHFNEVQKKAAFSAAITSAAGVLEMIEGDSEMKPYNVGRATLDGIVAAYIGKAQFKPPLDALGGKRGFLKIMTDLCNMQSITDFNYDHFEIEGIYRKPYAACRHLHPSIEGALKIQETKKISGQDIDKILVNTYHLAVFGHDHKDICGVNSAKMSIPYSVAVALLKGKAGMSEFTEKAITNNDVLQLAQKVEVQEDENLTSLCPHKRAAIVTVYQKNGKRIDMRVDYPKGEPENPLSRLDVCTKFRQLASFAQISTDNIEKCIQRIYSNEYYSIADIISPLVEF